ncbi:hypothetical protein PAXINDRAFT_19470 [Paxillus involutus ATCC 200175]|uniref:Uncharacterized protein n=1 Tax=Paxillus involutus ATCC 200175 TaxID=664439 RepID=A0A0C9TJ26_PAXIN|nr:hypothetical protein PAXINDRAFT_19470 [Paxillus involutus ATCC 200175]
MSASSQLVALVNVDDRVPVWKQGSGWVDGQNASQMDRTLSVRDSRRLACLHSPHNSPKTIHNDRQSRHWLKRHEAMNRPLSAVDSPTIFPPETSITRLPELSEEAN